MHLDFMTVSAAEARTLRAELCPPPVLPIDERLDDHREAIHLVARADGPVAFLSGHPLDELGAESADSMIVSVGGEPEAVEALLRELQRRSSEDTWSNCLWTHERGPWGLLGFERGLLGRWFWRSEPKPRPASNPHAYTSGSIRILGSMAAVRKRPGMYFGSDVGLAMVQEVLGNSVDAFLAGQVAEIGLYQERDGFRVEDDGPGIPLEAMEDGVGTVESWVTELHQNATRDGHSPHVHLGPTGMGLAPICAVSSSLTLEAHRPSGHYRQHFSRGRATGPVERLGDGFGRGSTVRWVVDRYVARASVSDRELKSLAERVAPLFPGLRIVGTWGETVAHDGLAAMVRRRRNGQVSWAQGKRGSFDIQAAWMSPSQAAGMQTWVNGREAAGAPARGIEAALGSALASIDIALHVIAETSPFGSALRTVDDPEMEEAVRAFVVEHIA